MINACFRGLTASLITDFSSAFDFNKPFISYDISTGLFSIHTDNSMDLIVMEILIKKWFQLKIV